MTETVIQVENVGKRYVLGTGGDPARYQTMRESLMSGLRAPARWLRRSLNGAHAAAASPADNEFWALHDVSFKVQRGDVVGIIGRNGAGKSTLLKVLSRITEPTRGRVAIRGRVASLLEVGTGFHPELTGRENIYLNGAILGMTRVEIKAKFDEIVAFSEVERFLDTPVKRYSSGMYVRLAFAVAAHLEPEILIVDEVLAVGDANFQKKCLSKMQDVGQGGRTVLFVSHSMPAITRLCTRAILLNEGRVLSDGPTAQVVSAYLGSGLNGAATREWPDPAKAPGNHVARLRAVRVLTGDSALTDAVDIRLEIRIILDFDVLQGGPRTDTKFSFFQRGGGVRVHHDRPRRHLAHPPAPGRPVRERGHHPGQFPG